MPFPGRAYLQYPEWTWLIVLEMFVAAVAAGTYFAYGSIEIGGHKEDRRVTHVLGLIPLPLIALAGLILIVDLGQPLRFVNLLFTSASAVPERGGPFMLNPNSPLGWGTYVILIFGVFALVAFIDSLGHAGRMRSFPRLEAVAHNKVFQAVGGLFGLATGSYSGVLLNVTQQTVWGDTIFHGALYTSEAAFAGVGVAALVARRYGTDGLVRAIRDALVAIALINALILLALVVTLGPFAQPLLVSLTVAPAFWLGVVILGLAVPLWLLIRPNVTRDRLAFAGVLALVAALSVRYSIVFSALAALHG